MATKNEANESLSLLFACDGVLPACICNIAKEMIQGNLFEKLNNAAYQLK